MLTFAQSSHEATKKLINTCWNTLLHKAQRKSVGPFWTGPEDQYELPLYLIFFLVLRVI